MTDPHAITITQHPGQVTVTARGKTVASSHHAFVLNEGGMDPVFYIPRDDADMALLDRTDHASHCPFKGDASYYSIVVDGDRRENAVWTYETPKEAVAAIKDHLAFYPTRVDSITS